MIMYEMKSSKFIKGKIIISNLIKIPNNVAYKLHIHCV